MRCERRSVSTAPLRCWRSIHRCVCVCVCVSRTAPVHCRAGPHRRRRRRVATISHLHAAIRPSIQPTDRPTDRIRISPVRLPVLKFRFQDTCRPPSASVRHLPPLPCGNLPPSTITSRYATRLYIYLRPSSLTTFRNSSNKISFGIYTKY